MKFGSVTFVLFSLITINLMIALNSCGNPRKELPPYPKEECGDIVLYDLPIITHGFSESKYNSATVQTFEKGSNFETNHLKQFGIQLDKYSDIARETRTFSLPKEVTTAYDLKIIFSGDLEYKITEMTVDWEENWYIEEGYECNLISYKLNGKLDSRGSNIIINEPNYRFD